MDRDEDKQLWDLLGRGRAPKLSPFFARNVVRQARQETREGRRTWFSRRRLIPAFGVALATIVTVMIVRNPSSRDIAPEAAIDPLIAKIDVQDYDVVADLDNLLASDENSPWDENSTL